MNIWMAASDGELETVKTFLAGGGDVNAKDENGYTPLYVRCRWRYCCCDCTRARASLHWPSED